MKQKPHFIHRRKVEFSETDMAGIVHFANFYRWMEAAEVGWFEANDLRLFDTVDGAVIGWPRVRSQCDFHAPAFFRDAIEVRLWINEVKIRAIAFAFRFYRVMDGNEEHVASGSLTTVCALRDPATGTMHSRSIPSAIQVALEQAVGQAGPQ